ncbi:unnamed protein product [Gongylonema pulchrum]|uniref:Methyltransf_11 domain-containing protein n=1 Tax=Gongylonema pulchrum TaxID=637853 RepID=A0A183EM50_9BILA|nr:unnamed protein product [Gongylonema pulchrum]
MDTYVKPTLTRSKVKNEQHRTFCSSLEEIRNLVKPREFDVILAVEMFNTDKIKFEEIHDLIDYALSNDGICCRARLYSAYDHVKVCNLVHFANSKNLPESSGCNFISMFIAHMGNRTPKMISDLYLRHFKDICNEVAISLTG